MADGLVCNINFYLYIRFIFGFYHKFEASEWVRWLARFYCCLVCINLIIWLLVYPSNAYPLFVLYLIFTEFLLYTLISLWKNNKYLLEYYKKMPLVDEVNIDTYKPMRLYLIGYMFMMLLFKIFGLIKYVVRFWSRHDPQRYFCILELIAWCTNLVGRVPILFVFALLYIRMKSMRKRLEDNNFEFRNLGDHHPRRYIQMYEVIMDGLEKSGGGIMKLQLFIFVMFSTTFYLVTCLYSMYLMKNNPNVEDMIDFTWFMSEIAMGYSPLFLSAILADMVSMEVQEMLAIIVERRIACNNERDRAEVQSLFQLMRGRPFEYNLLRVLPLNLRSLLNFLSFSITTIIAIIQVMDWVK